MNTEKREKNRYQVSVEFMGFSQILSVLLLFKKVENYAKDYRLFAYHSTTAILCIDFALLPIQAIGNVKTCRLKDALTFALAQPRPLDLACSIFEVAQNKDRHRPCYWKDNWATCHDKEALPAYNRDSLPFLTDFCGRHWISSLIPLYSSVF